MKSLSNRVGIRAKILIAPAVVLLLTAIIGLFATMKLQRAADLAHAQSDRTSEVELVRDANSEQFESDRFQWLALSEDANNEPKAAAEARDEAMETLQESIGHVHDVARTTPSDVVRREALGQARLVQEIGVVRKDLLARAAKGENVNELTDKVEEITTETDEA